MYKYQKLLMKSAIYVLLAVLPTSGISAQTKRSAAKKRFVGPVVTRIDIDGLRSLISPKGKPLLINFWATWCDPCREEFPDLVQIDAQYKGKIDFVTVSLDDLAEIRTSVPKFLGEMKATMPAYLLKTPDESAAIMLVAKDWSGNLPMTVLILPNGEAAYVKSGKVNGEILRAEIEKLVR